MMPFLHGQLDVGEFVYDATARVMRATVYGLERSYFEAPVYLEPGDGILTEKCRPTVALS